MFGFVACIRYKLVLIVVTAFNGAYMVIRGISIFAGGYPNEFTLISKIKNKDLDSVPWEFYIYLLGIACLTGIGMLV